MKNLCPLLFVFFLIYWSCSDTIPPTVSITSHTSGQTVNKIVPIKVTTQDNEEISRVEFFIDDSLVLSDTEIPYEGYWNTSQYEEGSKLIAKVISYDISDNSTESQPLSLIIDNSDFYLTPSVLYPITYNDAYQISDEVAEAMARKIKFEAEQHRKNRDSHNYIRMASDEEE